MNTTMSDQAQITIPTQVVEAHDYQVALNALTTIAEAFEGNGWDFLGACQEAHQRMGS